MTRRTARIIQGRRRDRRRAASWTASTSASVPAPAAESLGSRPMSTSAVASASASARCRGVVRAHEELDEVIPGRLNRVPGVTHTETHIAFRTYSRHDLESAFAIGYPETT